MYAGRLTALVLVAGPALASPPRQADTVLAIAFVRTGRNAAPPICIICY